jgi:hypothetical protein
MEPHYPNLPIAPLRQVAANDEYYIGQWQKDP